MHRLWVLLIIPVLLTGCATQPPPTPPKPVPAVPILFGTPTQQPVTPALEALMKGQIDQQMLMRFTVRADGSVENPKAVFSNLSPVDTADVVAAFQDWRFKPAMDGTQPVARDFIYPLFFGPNANQDRTRFMCRNEKQVYEPDSRCEIVTVGKWRIYRMNPVYPPELLNKHQAGSVTLSFEIGAHGQTVNPKVQGATPPGLFDSAALAAVKQWYVEPLTGENGVGPTQQVTVTVKFTPPSASQANPVQITPP
jgi:TonB family protein